MRALILAAGLGSRLFPITHKLPKALVKVNGTPILFKQIDNLLENGIGNITVVSGYLSSAIKEYLDDNYKFVNIIENYDYQSTNNMYSAFLAKSLFDDELIMMNADVFFESSIIKNLLDTEHADAIAVDVGNYLDESMKVTYDGERVTGISKSISREEAYGTSIDVYKFSKRGADAFIKKCVDYIEVLHHKNLWSEVALNDILKQVLFFPCKITGRWVEIDNHEDLSIAMRLFRE